MVSLLSLWLPILLSAVFVFVASSVIHMFLTYHQKDFQGASDEDGLMDAMRGFGLQPGDYAVPYAGSMEVMRSDEFQAKAQKGPVVFMTVYPPEAMTDMTKNLIQWFVYCLVIGFIAAYVASRTLTPGAEYLAVFRITGTIAFACYAMSLPQRSIWFRQNWGATLRTMLDGFVYALLTAGAFGAFWPDA